MIPPRDLLVVSERFLHLGFRGALMILSVLLAGCEPDIQKSETYPSPDGKFTVHVLTELQAENDPRPWWVHVSLVKTDSQQRLVPGNVAVLEGRQEPEIRWLSGQELRVIIPASSKPKSKLPPVKEHDGIKVLIERTQP